MKKRTRVFVSGRVQGVYFRVHTQRRAHESGVNGWVRNLDDGRVEAVFEGEPAAVDSVVGWARRGPDNALVTDLEQFEEPVEGLSGFTIRD